MDEVDRILAAWARELPELDTSPLASLSRLSRLDRHLERARRRAFAGQQLEQWEFDVLAALRRSGEPYRLSPGQLVEATHVTSGTMTNRVDGLERRGLVERFANPSDGRGVLVGLTASGKQTVDTALADLIEAESALLTGLDADERQQLAGLLRALLLCQ